MTDFTKAAHCIPVASRSAVVLFGATCCGLGSGSGGGGWEPTCCQACFALLQTLCIICSRRHQHYPDAKPREAPGRQERLHEPGRVGAAAHPVQLQDLQRGQRRLLRRDEVPCKCARKNYWDEILNVSHQIGNTKQDKNLLDSCLFYVLHSTFWWILGSELI